MHSVVFKNGEFGLFKVYSYLGGCLTGDPTAYIYRNKQLTWIKPSRGYFVEA